MKDADKSECGWQDESLITAANEAERGWSRKAGADSHRLTRDLPTLPSFTNIHMYLIHCRLRGVYRKSLGSFPIEGSFSRGAGLRCYRVKNRFYGVIEAQVTGQERRDATRIPASGWDVNANKIKSKEMSLTPCCSFLATPFFPRFHGPDPSPSGERVNELSCAHPDRI